ncbi:MAG: PAS domain S-box protein [Rhodothermales bacterium]|nr:PAS domain S-box protein [Rhodothermales bacterium]
MMAETLTAFVPFVFKGVNLSDYFISSKTPAMHPKDYPSISASIINLDAEIANCIGEILHAEGCHFSVVSSVPDLDRTEQALVFIAGGTSEEAQAFCRQIHERDTSQQPVITLVVTDSGPEFDDFLHAGADDIIHYRGNLEYCTARVRLIMDRSRARAMRWLAEDALSRSTAMATAVLETTVDGIITIDERGKIETINSAVMDIFGYAIEELIGENVSILMPDPFKAEHDEYLTNYLETGHRKIIGIGREVVGRRKDGSLFPLDLAVSEVKVGTTKRLFTGILRDISERRKLERELLRVGDLERRRIGQDLHDGLGQMLTGIGLITQNLGKSIRDKDEQLAEEISEVSDLVKEADRQARTLARNLSPVDLEAAGLDSALGRLALNIEKLFGIRCRYESNGAVSVDDNSTATHLFRIAQEAISNAVTHGKADVVRIELSRGSKTLRLRIIDNGSGFRENEERDSTRGMGIHIMNYRAKMVGGSLDIVPSFDGGTVVSCTVRLDMLPISFDATRKENGQ